jgi:hypothetical protein
MTLDKDRFKALALAFESAETSEAQLAALAEFNSAANPAAVLELIAEVERLRTELAAGAARQGGDTSGKAAVEKAAKSDSKTAETRMDSGFDGGGVNAAPAAGTDRDAARLLAAIVRSDVGMATRHKLEDGQGTATDDGKNWLAAIEFVAAIGAHSKAGEPAQDKKETHD